MRRSTGPSSWATAAAGDWRPDAAGCAAAGSAASSAALLVGASTPPCTAAASVSPCPWPAGGLSYSWLRFMMLSSRWWGVGSSVGLRPSPPACGVLPESLPWWPGVSAATAAGVDAGLGTSPGVYFLASSRMDSGTEVEERRFQEGERTLSAAGQVLAGGTSGTGAWEGCRSHLAYATSSLQGVKTGFQAYLRHSCLPDSVTAHHSLVTPCLHSSPPTPWKHCCWAPAASSSSSSSGSSGVPAAWYLRIREERRRS